MMPDHFQRTPEQQARARDAATTSNLAALRRMAVKRDPLSVPTWDEVLRLVLVAETARDYLAATNTLGRFRHVRCFDSWWRSIYGPMRGVYYRWMRQGMCVR